MLNIVGRSFASDTVAIKNAEGDWEVTVSMVEKRMEEGKDWEEKVISTKCTNTDFAKAYQVAMTATMDKYSDAVETNGHESLFPPVDTSME